MLESIPPKKWLQRLPIGLVALALGSMLVGSPAHAATFDVTEVTDAGDANPGDGVCASILFGGPCTLRAAVQEANALPGPDVILLPALYFALTIPGNGEDGAITGDLDITDAVVIQGADRNATVVDGTGLDGAFELFAAGVTFSSFTIDGAGVRSTSPDATFDEMVLFESDLTVDSGQLSIQYGEIYFASIVNHAALDSNGTYFFFPDSPAISNMGGTLDLRLVTIENGTTGIWNQSGEVVMRYSTLTNVDLGVENDGIMVIEHSSFTQGGTGVRNDVDGRMILRDSRIGNSNGGGLGVVTNYGVLFATNLQVAFNTSTPTTAALTSCNAGLTNYPSGIVQLTQSTFYGNSVGVGPIGSCAIRTGLDVLGLAPARVRVSSTLLLSSVSGKPACAGDPVVSGGYNVDRAFSCGLSGPGDLSNTNVALTTAADGFLEPTPGSIAIGSGSPSCPLTDARGFARKTVTPCDRGAIEYAANTACINGLDDDGDGLIDGLDPGCLWIFDELEVDLAPGDILLTSAEGGQVFSVDPVSGRREVLAAAGGIAGPTGVVRASDGSIYVSSLGVLGTAGGPLMRIDPLTGEQSVVAWDESALASVTGMIELPNGNLALTSPGINQVVEVDPATGAVSTLATGPTGFDPRGLSRDPTTGNLFVAASSGTDRLFELVGGVAVPVALAGGATVGIPRDLEVVGDQAYISDSANPDQLLRVDVLTGDVASITTLKTAPRGVGVEVDGSVLVADRTANELVRVDPDTGAQEIFAVGPLIDDAYFLAIVEPPEPCIWTRYGSQARFEAALSGEAEVFDFSTVALDGNGDAGFSNGHDFGPFTWTSLTLASDIDLFGSPASDGTLHVTNGILPPQIQGWPGGIGGAGTPANDDDFRLDFAEATTAAGIEILDNRVEAGERIEFRDDQDQVIASFELPGDASGVAALPDGNGFVGLAVCPGTPLIRSIVIKEGATVGSPANDNIGFTNVVYVPEPARLAGLGAGLLLLMRLGRRRRRSHERNPHLPV